MRHAQTTAGFTVLSERAAEEAELFGYQLDYVMHCDASDHALAAIVIKAPDEEDLRRPFYRRLQPHEAAWSSVLRELTGYRDAYLTLRRRRNMSGMVIEIVGRLALPVHLGEGREPGGRRGYRQASHN